MSDEATAAVIAAKKAQMAKAAKAVQPAVNNRGRNDILTALGVVAAIVATLALAIMAK